MRDFTADPALAPLCRTELHMRLLWDSKGAAVEATERYSKFSQLLAVLSERAESSHQPQQQQQQQTILAPEVPADCSDA